MIRLIEHLEDLGQIREACNELADFLGRPFLRSEWLEFCMKAFYAVGRLNVLVRESWNGISGIAPFARTADGDLRLLGTGSFPVPSGFLFRDDSTLVDLTSETFRLSSPLHIHGLEPESPEARAFESETGKQHLVLRRRAIPVPWLPISGTWANFLKHLSPEKKSCLHTYRDFATSIGEVAIEIDSPTPDQSNTIISELQKQEEIGRWQPTPAALFLRYDIAEHFREYARALAASSMLRVGILKINGEWIAVHLGFEYRRKLWSLGLFYDKRWGAWSPDALLMHQIVHSAFDTRLRSIEIADGVQSRFRLSNGLMKKIYEYRICPPDMDLTSVRVRENGSLPVEGLERLWNARGGSH